MWFSISLGSCNKTGIFRPNSDNRAALLLVPGYLTILLGSLALPKHL